MCVARWDSFFKWQQFRFLRFFFSVVCFFCLGIVLLVASVKDLFYFVIIVITYCRLFKITMQWLTESSLMFENNGKYTAKTQQQTFSNEGNPKIGRRPCGTILTQWHRNSSVYFRSECPGKHNYYVPRNRWITAPYLFLNPHVLLLIQYFLHVHF